MSRGRRDENFVPWFKREDTWLQLVLLLITLGVVYIFLTENMKGWQGIWVLVNVVGGYIILNNPRMRKKVREIWGGVLRPVIWGFALVNLLLVIVAGAAMVLFFSSGGGGSGGGGNGNPFVSNILLVIVLFPIIPLFADAETYLFQALFLGLFLKSDYRNCKECGKVSPPGIPCAHCGATMGGDKLRGAQVWLAILISSLVFAGAHMLLLMSFTPIILMVGGVILGWAYLNKGHQFTAQVHLVYDLILITLLFIVYLLSDIGGF
ncbi:MAG: hypothetical protein ACMUIE_10765 [Thermoplasmatota archaeon]